VPWSEGLPSWLRVRQVTVPMAESTTGGLDGWMVYPAEEGKHPLVIMTAPEVVPEKVGDEGPGTMLPEAEWFVRRGWAVGIYLRRGFGRSGKFPHIGIIKCGTQDMEEYEGYQTRDRRAALAYFVGQPEVDASRVISVSDSGTWGDGIWIVDGAPEALKAVVEFGNRGLYDERLYREKCLRGSALPALRRVGGVSKVPLLLVFGKVDAGHGEETTRESVDAFTGAGGRAEAHYVKAYDPSEAGYLFSMDAEEWGPVVQEFLAKQGLPSIALVDPPAAPEVALPAWTSVDAKKAFTRYLLRGPNKAFALGPNGAWSYRWGNLSLAVAQKETMESCERCVMVASDGVN
jgi:hypothetical protein